MSKTQIYAFIVTWALFYSTLNSHILHSEPSFRDVVNNTIVDYAKAEEFVKLLTHESYFIQIPKLVEPTKTRIERILSIFNQTFKTTDVHTLNYDNATDDPLLQKMVSRLTRAIASEDVRRRMNIEDEIESDYAEFQESIDQQLEMIRQQDLIIDQKDQVLVEKDQALVEKDQALVEKDQALVEKDQALVEKDQALEVERQKVELLMQRLADIEKQADK